MSGSQRPTADDVRRAIADEGIEFLFAQFVDMHAKPSAKLIPSQQLEGLLADGAGFAGFAAGDIGQTPDNPDLIAMPDVGSFTRLPWKPEIAWFACDATVEGEEWPYCPRTILRHQLERASDAGFEFKIGCELEYFLVRQTDDGGIEIADPLDTLEQPCYDIRALTRSFDFVADVVRNVNSLGWNLYATDHEDANGQFEQNFDFADALTTCDRAVFYRYMVEAMAQERGLIATFMPKPFAHLTGNGCHFHMSLWDGDTNLFARDRDDDPRNLGLSDLAYNFIGGLKAHAKAYIALSAPTVSSYKRLVIGAPASGATWAPAYVTYGWNNRTMMLRIPDGGPDRGPDRGRLVQPVPGRHRGARRGHGRDRARARSGRPDDREHVRDQREPTGRRWGSRPCPRTCSTRHASSRGTRSCARPWARWATRTTSTTSSAVSGASGRWRTSRSRSGNSTATCSCSETGGMSSCAGSPVYSASQPTSRSGSART